MADSFYLKIWDKDIETPALVEVNINSDWTIIADLDSKTSFSATITSLEDLTKIYVGAQARFFNYDNEVLFDGFIKSIDKEDPFGNDEVIYYHIQAVCWCKIAQRQLIGDIAENKSVADVITDHILPVLAEEGVTAGNIECDLMIERIVFPYITCYEALNMLQTLVYGYQWSISDEYKTLGFSYIANSYLETKVDNNIYYRNFKQSRDMNIYRNTQYLRGGKARTTTQTNETPTPPPDLSSRTFTLRFPVAEEPTIEISLGGGAWNPVANVGINGIDEDAAGWWYFTYNSPNITQNSVDANALNVGDAIRVTYIGLRDIFILVDDQDQIRRRAEIEDHDIDPGAGVVDGTSGIYENITEETSIDTVETGIQFASGLLKKYGDIADRVTFDTEDDNFKWSLGHLVKIEKESWDINEYFLINQVAFKQLDPTHIQYSITALDGATVGGWELYFAEMLRRDKKFTINDSEVLVLVKNQLERINHYGEYDLEVYNPLLYVSESTDVSESTVLGGTLAQEETIYD